MLDASVTLAWLLREMGDWDLPLRELELWLPSVWTPEVWTGLLRAERRGRPVDQQRLQELGRARLRHAPFMPDQMVTQVVPLARTYGLSVYDASYLHLALGQNCPLATLDSALQSAAAQAGVPTL